MPIRREKREAYWSLLIPEQKLDGKLSKKHDGIAKDREQHEICVKITWFKHLTLPRPKRLVKKDYSLARFATVFATIF